MKKRRERPVPWGPKEKGSKDDLILRKLGMASCLGSRPIRQIGGRTLLGEGVRGKVIF